jgi:hypothetical protein
MPIHLGFLRRRDFIGGRAMSKGGQGAHTIPWRGQRGGHATRWCGCLLALLCLCFGLCLMSGKIGTLGFISSNSENISCVTFLKHKNNRKRELALWHLVNRLVPYHRFHSHGASKIIDTLAMYHEGFSDHSHSHDYWRF